MNRTTHGPRRWPARATGRERPDHGLRPRLRADARGADGRREAGAAEAARPLPYPCGTDTTIEVWLKQPVGSDAGKITWTGSQCELLNTANPLDAKSWPCGPQETITQAHPKARNDEALIEV